MKKIALLILMILVVAGTASGRGLLLSSGAVLELASGDVMELAMPDPTAYTLGSGGSYETWPSIVLWPGDNFTLLNSGSYIIDAGGYNGTESDPITIYGDGYTITGAHVLDGDWWIIYQTDFSGYYSISGDHVKLQRHGVE